MEEPLIDYKVRAFAEYLGCDPKLAQELKQYAVLFYFELRSFKKLDRWGSLDGQQIFTPRQGYCDTQYVEDCFHRAP